MLYLKDAGQLARKQLLFLGLTRRQNREDSNSDGLRVTMHFEKLRTLKKNSKCVKLGPSPCTLNFGGGGCKKQFYDDATSGSDI